jgi:tellurite methyltransferase
VQRKIVGFHQDNVGDWVAVLACGHGRHMRHKPPWEARPWVLTPEGRQRQLGIEVDCSTCEAAGGDPRDTPSAMDLRNTAVARLST